MKTKEEILESYLTDYPWECWSKENALNGMQEYASQQTAKYKELVEAQDELIKFITNSHTITIGSTTTVGQSYPDLFNKIKELTANIEQLRNELNT